MCREAEMGETSEKGSEEPDLSTRQSIESPAGQTTSEKSSRKDKSSKKKEKPKDSGWYVFVCVSWSCLVVATVQIF